ncbi:MULTISPECIES: hypothetical protein [Cupriavidus]
MTIDYIEKAQQDTLAELLIWVQQVVEGRGESISQMVVSVVLGCIPGVGQAIDAYNILRSLYQLIRDSDNADHWLELVLCLIALVPGFGDALKNVFRMLRNGKAMARILDSLPATVRGNIEKWFRELNWAAYTAELIANTNRILDGLIDLFSTRVARWVLDKQGLQRLVAQLKGLKSKATQKITEAMDSLQVAHQHAMAQPIPNTTAHVPSLPNAPHNSPPGSHAPSPKPAGSQAPRQPERQAPQSGTKHQDLPANTGGTTTPRQGQANAQQRQSTNSKKGNNLTGVSGEHIADYYFVKSQTSRKKINNSDRAAVNEKGMLYEMLAPDGNGTWSNHHGIDHVWYSHRLPANYRISDTKGTRNAKHRLETSKRVLEALRFGLDVYLNQEDDKRVRSNVNRKVTRDGVQMSHRWIVSKIRSAALVAEHDRILMPKIREWRRANFKLGMSTDSDEIESKKQLVQCPYDRSLLTVVAANHDLHDGPKGNAMLAYASPCNRARGRHRISREFVIPTNILIE